MPMFIIFIVVVAHIFIFFGEFVLRRYQKSRHNPKHFVAFLFLSFLVTVVLMLNLRQATEKIEIVVLSGTTFLLVHLLTRMVSSIVSKLRK